eukprot:CAMPEP_0195283680 /NCGR_PEP_ID=MMETSP0707-20130614/2142_1 /TAXON_ID=33640 /ORGANISM="Asterionellopsis glacialis, Strain CCMP134" /LENGTH=277 /DNA_ID=CAMNT_0040342891 /DNA_START=39 /DNA_END=872 /DNA_ORIENTATION=-
MTTDSKAGPLDGSLADNDIPNTPEDNDKSVGTDSEGRKYESVEEMAEVQGWKEPTARREWYERAADHYEWNCPASVDGVLGGFGSISDLDLEGSQKFINKLGKDRDWTIGAAAECGAGIGRVSKGLLLPLGVTRCDLVESSSRLLAEAPEYIGNAGASKCRYYCVGLQDWTPKVDTYTIIWIQWVFCYLTDDDCVDFLKRCGKSLKSGGLIFIKENTCSEEEFVVDSDDASVTRSVNYLKKLFDRAGLRVVSQEMQDNFPDEIFAVPMIALDVPPSP